VAGSWERGYESYGSVKFGKFFDYPAWRRGLNLSLKHSLFYSVNMVSPKCQWV